MIKTEIYHACPACSADEKVELKEIFQFGKTNSLTCSTFKADLLITDDNIKITHDRVNDVKSLMSYQSWATGITFGAMLLEFFNFISLELFIFGFLISICMFARIYTTNFPKIVLQTKESTNDNKLNTKG